MTPTDGKTNSVQGIETHFLPASRLSQEEFSNQLQLVDGKFLALPGVRTVLQAVAHPLLLINMERQILYANEAASALVNSAVDIVATRPGEALGCVGANLGTSGCGTAAICRLCGLVNTIWSAFQNSSGYAEGECRIQTTDAKGFLLRVQGTRIDISGHPFVLASLTDVAGEDRRRVLERTFFHDVLNTANVVFMTSQLLATDLDGEQRTKALELVESVGRLIDEIQGQRILMEAEKGELRAPMAVVDSYGLVSAVAGSYKRVYGTGEVRLELEVGPGRCTIHTDPSLLSRVLSNLIKNAFEAARPGDTVTVRCSGEGGYARFEIHNPKAMPEYVRLQVFSRSFSTKGAGRGVGTYSARLLTENYLGGRIGFDSVEGQGTTFWVEVPRAPQ